MLISTIIVNYNAGRHLVQAVKNASRYAASEVIIVDNASTDGSLVGVTKLKLRNVHIIKNAKNLGFAKATNQAARLAQGEYLLLLNPDAELTAAAVARLIQTCQDYHDTVITAPALVYADGTPQPSCYRRQSFTNAIREFIGGTPSAYSKYRPVTTQAHPVASVDIAVAAVWCVPRKIWDELHGLDERFFLYFEDLDFCDRLRAHGYQVVYESRAKATHIHGLSAATNQHTGALFAQSARTYHGRLKKWSIDLVIHLGSLLYGPPTWKRSLLIVALSTLGITAVAALGYLLLPARQFPLPLLPPRYTETFLLWSWANFDGEHYLHIASAGYQTIRGQSEYAFFPLYPLLIKGLSYLTGGDYYGSALGITYLSLWGFVWLGARWAKQYLAHPYQAIWAILLSSGAVFLHAVYTEPLFLLLTVAVFWFADQKAWGKALVCTALATLTRINGIFLVGFLALKMSGLRPWQRLTYPLAGLTGLGAYMTYLYLKTGDALAFFHAQAGWGKATATSPLTTLERYGTALTTAFVPDLTHLVVFFEVLTAILMLFLVLRHFRLRQPGTAYAWYALGNLALPLATGSLGSLPRFALTLIPALAMTATLKPRPLRWAIWLIGAVMGMIGTVLFVRGYWYA